MREDMAKVIVERPRRGSSGRLKGRIDQDLESQPTKQGMKYRLADTKSLNENLAPLRRYLASQVGRPWSKVYSEISAHLRVTNAVQRYNKAGEPMNDRGWWYPYDFYVDPRDGILKRGKADTDKARKRAKERRKQRLVLAACKINRIKLVPRSDLRQLNGIWFAVIYSTTPEGVEVIEQKRQLSTKELRRRKLANKAA